MVIDLFSFFVGFLFAFLLGAFLLYLLGFNYAYFVSKYVRPPQISEVHVEKILDDQCYDRLVGFARRHPDCMLMLTVRRWRGRNEETIRKRYLSLKELGNPLGLHVHLAIKPEIDELTFREQKRMIRRGIDFLRALGIHTEDFAPGWWSYNEDTVRACRELGLKRFHVLAAEDHVDRKLGVDVVVVKRYIHDWEIP